MSTYNYDKALKVLELERILEALSSHASTEKAKENALAIKPSFDYKTVSDALKQTEDAYILIAKYSAPSFGGVVDITGSIARSRIGAALSIKELLGVASVLKTVRSVRFWRNECKSGDISFEHLFSALNPNKFLEDKIYSCIKTEDELNDNASPLLFEIRRKIISRSSKIRDDLDKIVRGNLSKYLQESIITQRDGRFVVPVKSEHKGEIKGIVHDTSSSGSTLFVEPMSVVEANNEIRVLRSKEQDEILRILSELSSLVADFSDSIEMSYNALIEMDLIFAKAKLAYGMDAVVPKLNTNGYICLKRARHPLISKKTVVPITVSLGGEFDTLVITGPNTGGKTVTLKTVGLLTLMTLCGLMIPADDSSEVAVFDGIFADIGDEQSIEQSLSTFSSHIVNIIDILGKCSSNSLVLFDELCAGTDPVEGAALAKAILMHLSEKNVKTVATTHYPELKSYALDTDRVENASCEFDIDTLKPTYRLIIGMPGRSNAFAISKRLGLDDGIIKLASGQISEDDMRFERVVSSLERARRDIENEKQTVSKLRTQLNEEKKRNERMTAEYEKKRQKMLEEANEKARQIVDDTRYRSANLINELEEIKKNFNSENAASKLEKARLDYKKSLEKLEDTSHTANDDSALLYEPVKTLNKGDTVIINAINADASVLDVNELQKKAFVISGSMKMWVDYSGLSLSKSKPKKENGNKMRNVTGNNLRENRSVSAEIDIRGMASDEAIFELDKYIDNAVIGGIGTVTIIHGKGTGVLRRAVHTYLRGNKYVKTFRIGLFGEGENGVTIAEIER